MATPHLTRTAAADLDPAASAVIESYLERLGHRLPGSTRRRAGIIVELRDDLVDATAALAAPASSPTAAARAAINEFGDVETVAAAFRSELAARSVRRVGVTLLATGPLVGGCWATAALLLAPAPVWRWPLLLAVPLVLLAAPATVLTVAATGRLTRRLGPPTALASGAVAGGAAIVADLILLAGTAALLVFSTPAPPALWGLAASASLARIAFVVASIIDFQKLLPVAAP